MSTDTFNDHTWDSNVVYGVYICGQYQFFPIKLQWMQNIIMFYNKHKTCLLQPPRGSN